VQDDKVIARLRRGQQDSNKPKARDVQRFLVSAAAMQGDEVDKDLKDLVDQQTRRRDLDDVMTRDKLKLKRSHGGAQVPAPRGAGGAGSRSGADGGAGGAGKPLPGSPRHAAAARK
jgi:hypothetical protein